MEKKIQVAVRLTIELDPDDWTLAYGVEGLPAIREDIRIHIHTLVQGLFAHDTSEYPGTVTLR